MYIVSHEAADVEFPRYVRTKSGVDAQSAVLIKGGAGVINKKTMETPNGVITEISKEELAFLKTQHLFKKKVEQGAYEIGDSEGKNKRQTKRQRRTINSTRLHRCRTTATNGRGR